MPKANRFAERELAVTMTGKEWFTIIAKLANRKLSDKGNITFASASKKLQQQIGAAVDEYPNTKGDDDVGH